MSQPPPPPVAASTPQMTPSYTTPAAQPTPLVVQTPVPAPVAPAPAPAVDLLDFGWDSSQPAETKTPSTVDMLTPTPLVVEPVAAPVALPPEPSPAPPVNADPFADAGLLDGFTVSAPLPSLSTSEVLELLSVKMLRRL